MKEIDILFDDLPYPDGSTRIRIFDYEQFTEAEKQILEELTEYIKGKDFKED